MFRNQFVYAGISGVLLACSGSDPGNPVVVGYPDQAATNQEVAGASGYNPVVAAPDPPPPFSTPFTTLVPNKVQWAGVTVELLAARLTRGMGGLLPSQVYVEVDLRIQNLGAKTVDYQGRRSWDLLLSDGSRKLSENALGLLIAPGDAPSTTLRYPVPDDTDLTGAAVELNTDDRQVEPFDLALDQAATSDPLVQLTDLQATTVTSGYFDYQIANATFGKNDVIGGLRAALNQSVLHLDLIVTNHADIDKFLDLDGLKIAIDGNSYSPVRSDNDLIDPGSSTHLSVVHTVPDGTTTFDLLFPAITGDRTRVTVNVANSVPYQP
ncbi:MAG TPA: hypothetical protein VL137_04840 [Polyangiaceae bacterium]|nr:hypothetical protein [Polyangiaceae bacterium]